MCFCGSFAASALINYTTLLASQTSIFFFLLTIASVLLAFLQHMRVQLNTRVPAKLREKVQADADRLPAITRDVVVGAILEDFFSAWTVSQREEFYRKYQSKARK